MGVSICSHILHERLVLNKNIAVQQIQVTFKMKWPNFLSKCQGIWVDLVNSTGLKKLLCAPIYNGFPVVEFISGKGVVFTSAMRTTKSAVTCLHNICS